MGERTAVILDCQPLWRDAIEDLLRQLGIRVIGKTGSGNVMVELVDAAAPDILVLGLDEAEDALACLRRARDTRRSGRWSSPPARTPRRSRRRSPRGRPSTA
jgi:chemotaxis response regulator CheB